MKVQILQENLSKTLSTAVRFVSVRAQLPILSNVLLKTQKTKLTIQATNLEVSISTSLGAKVEEEGKLSLPARTLADLISNLPKGPLALDSHEETLNLVSDNFNAKLIGMNAADFPVIPEEIGESAISLPKEKLIKALSQVMFATSTDETRPVLTGILFTLEGETLSLVATDGFRLSQVQLLFEKKPQLKQDTALKTILPKSAMQELSRVSGEGSDLLFEIKPTENQVLFGIPSRSGNTVLSSRVIEGEFPNFQKIIPKEARVKVRVEKDELLRAIKVASVISREAGYVGKLKVTKDSVLVTAESAKSGNQVMSVAAKVEGEEVEVMYNIRYIEEFLQCVVGDEVSIDLIDNSSAGVFKDATDPKFLHLIMPVKIQS